MAIHYNRKSMDKYGWTPMWFGCKNNDNVLVDAIKKYQREHGLAADGKVGPQTYRRIYTDRESNISKYVSSVSDNNYQSIVYDGNLYPIEWDKVILWDESQGIEARHYSKIIGEPREPKVFVNHWDVCLDSKMCQRVLNNRGLSVHFLIDNDGTIFQTCDIQHICYHAGKKVNPHSIGVEVANAYYLKHQQWYISNNLGERPIWTGTVRGVELEPHLGFYDVQVMALKALWKAVADACDIPLICPQQNGVMLDGYYSPAVKGNWKGFIHHYHISNNKIDCAGLDLKKHLEK